MSVVSVVSVLVLSVCVHTHMCTSMCVGVCMCMCMCWAETLSNICKRHTDTYHCLCMDERRLFFIFLVSSWADFERITLTAL